MTIDELLVRARSRLQRLEATDVPWAVARGAVIVDIRSELQRERDGTVACALHVPRNVLEWRCSPGSPSADPRVSDPGRRIILMCDEGYQSSLAAACLQELGMGLATDLVGGFQAWRAAGLPVEPGRSDVAAHALSTAIHVDRAASGEPAQRHAAVAGQLDGQRGGRPNSDEYRRAGNSRLLHELE
jgi:rhodanese-related sulfurtransferase